MLVVQRVTTGVVNGAASRKLLAQHGIIALTRITPYMEKSAETGVLIGKELIITGAILRMAVGITAHPHNPWETVIMDVTGHQVEWYSWFFGFHWGDSLWPLSAGSVTTSTIVIKNDIF